MVAFKKESLIMCVSPLQIVIAEKIISNNPDEIFDIIVLTQNENKKLNYYFLNILKITNKNLFFKYQFTTFKDKVNSFIAFKKKYDNEFGNKVYNRCYLASIDSKHFHYVLSQQKTAEIYTFDDGLANITQNGLYFEDDEIGFFSKIFFKILGVNINKKNIIEKSKLHFTIYKNCKNIINNVYYINLSKNNEIDIKKVEKNKKIYFFLGQPMHEIDSFYTQELVESYINKMNVDIYYRHPRENWNLNLKNVLFLDEEYIFEDYILKYMIENPETEIYIYSFMSSASLNLSSIDSLHVSFVADSFLLKRYHHLYEMALNKFGVNCIIVD